MISLTGSKNKFKFKGILALLLLTPVIALLIYVFLLYNEFGMFIALYKSKDCVNIKTSALNSNDYVDCLIYGHAVSAGLFNSKTLYEGLNYVINVVPERDAREPLKYRGNLIERLRIFPKDPSLWLCATDGKIIGDNKKEKIWLKGQYKCWPRNV